MLIENTKQFICVGMTAAEQIGDGDSSLCLRTIHSYLTWYPISYLMLV